MLNSKNSTDNNHNRTTNTNNNTYSDNHDNHSENSAIDEDHAFIKEFVPEAGNLTYFNQIIYLKCHYYYHY
jgi:hypothetical protein